MITCKTCDTAAQNSVQLEHCNECEAKDTTGLDKYKDLKAIPGEEVYSDYDDENYLYGVFGVDSGFCYSSTWADEEQAEQAAQEMNEKRKLNLVNKLIQNLNRVTFKPSCLNFGWGWKAEETFDKEGELTGFNMFSGFMRPDTHTGEMGREWGRPWAISLNYTDKELFMTAWMAIEQIIKHELLEAFAVDDARVFDPHKPMDALCFPEIRDIPEHDTKGIENQNKFLDKNNISKATKYTLYVETDWDFDVAFKGREYGGKYGGNFHLNLTSIKDLDKIIVTRGSKVREFEDGIKQIKENPNESFCNTGGNRGVQWWVEK